MKQPIRFAVVGSGNVARTYVDVLGKTTDAELAAIVSRSGNRPDNADERVPVLPRITAAKELCDAAILATPNGAHCDGAVEAAACGLHVLSEKVLDVTAAAMDEMIAACRDADVRLGVAFQRRMSPDNRAVKHLLAARAFGRLFAADLRVKYYRDQAYYDSAAYRGTRALDGGGPLIQQAAHNLDIYGWFFGLPRQVASMLDTYCHDIEGEDHAAAILRHANGMIGTITASTATKPGYAAVLEIHTEAGSLVLENDRITCWDIECVERPDTTTATAIHDGASSATVTETDGHKAILADFIEAIREQRDPAIPGEDARRATDLALAIYGAAIQPED